MFIKNFCNKNCENLGMYVGTPVGVVFERKIIIKENNDNFMIAEGNFLVISNNKV